jgi:uncharacterized protein YqjF (DUF2071 family)
MANYAVDEKLLESYKPFGTEIDLWNGTCYISLVGFMFYNTRVYGIKIPFHINFEEVNLRFYVRRKYENEWKSGVVFIKEIVPRRLIALGAKIFYKENYAAMPMRHKWKTDGDYLSVVYEWKQKNWNSIKVVSGKSLSEIVNGSEEEFITEHYWGYTKIKKHSTAEYEVRHPKWNIYRTKDYLIDTDFGKTYGNNFKFLNYETPVSVFLAEGSAIEIMPRRIV